jgi:1,2-phenylacetyl-CoA epoxidase catalytic subunit
MDDYCDFDEILIIGFFIDVVTGPALWRLDRCAVRRLADRIFN